MKEILEYALNRLDEACRNGEACDVQFWSGYCDGVRACMRQTEGRKEVSCATKI